MISECQLAKNKKKHDKRADLVLQIVNTDLSFVMSDDGWIGPCIHCNRKYVVEKDGSTMFTIEHIVPKGQGGTDDLKNLALSCKTCNNDKGLTHDQKTNQRSQEVIERLLKKRAKNWKGD